MLLIVGGGGVLLFGLAILLVLICFSGNTPAPAPPDNSDDGPIVVQTGPKKKPPPPPLVSLPPEEQKKVDAAVAKAAEFLKSRQLPNGTWGGFPLGMTSITGLTLLEAGLKPSDPPIQKAVAFVRGSAPNWNSGQETYELSLAVLFLDRLGDPQDKELIQKMILRLVAAQTPQGGWAYRCPQLSQDEYTQLYTALKELQHRTPEEVSRGQAGHVNLSPRVRNLAVLRPDNGNPKQVFRGGGDNSNTQFAILAMLVARKYDVPLERCLSLIVKRFRNSQNADGRWTYNGQIEVTPLPTMTCAGLLGLAVGFGLEEKDKHVGRPEDDPAVKKALEHLSKFVGQPGGNEAQVPMHVRQMYFLWSVERVAVLYQLKTINEKKWYHWGVEILMAHQRPDGAWKGGGHGSTDVLDTCFAILFLQRTNLAKDLTDKLEELRAARPAAGSSPARKD